MVAAVKHRNIEISNKLMVIVIYQIIRQQFRFFKFKLELPDGSICTAGFWLHVCFLSWTSSFPVVVEQFRFLNFKLEHLCICTAGFWLHVCFLSWACSFPVVVEQFKFVKI